MKAYCQPETPWLALESAQAADPRHTRLQRLNHVLEVIRADNPFYARKWQQAGVAATPLASVDEIATLPFTTRNELISDQTASPPLGTNLTSAASELKRFHRSSGTTQAPILWADSSESWQWVMHCSQQLWRLAGVRPADRILFPFSLGASSGPWIIYEGACRFGCACLPVGVPDLAEQRRLLTAFKPTVLAGKPSALQSLTDSAVSAGLLLRQLSVRKIILCGASHRTLRTSLEQSWAVKCFDRYGLTEAGSVAGECIARPGALHLLDDEFIAECVDPDSGEPVGNGQPGELVLTTLGRLVRPIVRYRTGDLVRWIPAHQCPCGRRGTMLLGGMTRI